MGKNPPGSSSIRRMTDRKFYPKKTLENSNSPIRIERGGVGHKRQVVMSEKFRNNIKNKHPCRYKTTEFVRKDHLDQSFLQLFLSFYRHASIGDGFKASYRNFFSRNITYSIGVFFNFFQCPFDLFENIVFFIGKF
jgi:hypothetical protein